MMSDVIQTLQRELAQLEGELREDPRYAKIQGIKDLLAVYTGSQVRPPNAKPPAPPTPNRRGSKGFESKRTKIRREVSDLLRRERSAHRTAILTHLVGKKLMGKESDPMAALAQLLSQSKDIFAFDGEGNWSLRET